MDRQITALDLRFLTKEMITEIIGGKIRKIYQEGRNFLFEFYRPGRGALWLFFDMEKVFLTPDKIFSAQNPTAFCMLLRKHLMGKTLSRVQQLSFDRIIELEFKESALIIEFLSPGNVILCDGKKTIIMPLENQRWKDREVRKHIPYSPPPLQRDPFLMDAKDIERLTKEGKKTVGAFLATTLGLGKMYGKEVCYRAKLVEGKEAQSLTSTDILRLLNTLRGLEKEFSPRLYTDAASPFALSREGGKSCSSFSEALQKISGAASPPSDEEGRVKRILASQKQAEDTWIRAAEENKHIAELLYHHYSLVHTILEKVREAREKGLSWEQIKSGIYARKTPEQKAIVEIKEKEGKIILLLDTKHAELDMRKSLEENAGIYFERAKQAKEKIRGIKEAQKKRVWEKGGKGKEAAARKRVVLWYEKFRWFFTSDGFLVIGGRNAEQNEALYHRYLKAGDKVFHADIPGASLVIIQSNGKTITNIAKEQAASFAAAYSKAWSRGLGSVDVYAVDPDQISKTPPSGMFLPKGSFSISGEREWFRKQEIKIALGIMIEGGAALIVCGPEDSLKRSAYTVLLKPGSHSPQQLSKRLNEIFLKKIPSEKTALQNISLDEIQRAIPGPASIAFTNQYQSGIRHK